MSASGVLGVGVSYLFRRGQEAWGSFCAGPRRPSGPCAAGCPLALAVARRSTTTCCFASTQEQEPPPSNTGNKLPQPPPQRKAPWKPRQTCWRRCPCCAGSRRWRSWRSLRGGGVCRNGRQRRPTSAACSRVPTTRLQGETKHYGVREDLSRQMSATGVLQPNGRRDHVTDRRECFRPLATQAGNCTSCLIEALFRYRCCS